jgi:hypothetical protein
MWVALFIFCTAIEGCTAVTFDDQKPKLLQYTEEKSDLVYEN